MKPSMIIISMLFISNLTLAQSPTRKGTYTLNGNISFSSQSYNNASTNDDMFLVNPQFGYFVINNIYVALSINYSHTSNDYLKTDIYGLGPAVRYFLDLSRTKPFIGLSYIFNKQIMNPAEAKSTTKELKITLGADIFMTDNFAIEASINYSTISYNHDYPMADNNPYALSSKLFQIGIGASYFIH